MAGSTAKPAAEHQNQRTPNSYLATPLILALALQRAGLQPNFFFRFVGRTTYPSDEGTRQAACTQTAQNMVTVGAKIATLDSRFKSATREAPSGLDAGKARIYIQRNAHSSVVRVKMR